MSNSNKDTGKATVPHSMLRSLNDDLTIIRLLKDNRFPVPMGRIVAKLRMSPDAVAASAARLSEAGIIDISGENYRSAMTLSKTLGENS